DMVSDHQKRERISAAIRGDEVLVQFLSEPRGGSDLAGVITRATRDGDMWVINGATTLSTSAYGAAYGLLPARTNWNVPKHRGLTMFLVKVNQPGVTLRRIKMVNGSTEFCEEFFDNVMVPADAVVGEVNNGWAVASRQLFYERTAVGGGSPYVSGVGRPNLVTSNFDLVDLVRKTGTAEDPRVRELLGEAVAHQRVQDQRNDRVAGGTPRGHLPDSASSILRLFHAETDWKNADGGLQIAGSAAVTGVVGEDGPLRYGESYLTRQSTSLGGGSTEMARNIISERVLGMPREFAADRDVPFSQVPQGRTS